MERGDGAPPVDLRYLEKAKRGERTSDFFPGIFSFLEQIYNSVAENLPNVRDTTYDSAADPYAIIVGAEILQPDSDQKIEKEPSAMAKRHRRGVLVNPSRTVQSGCKVR